MPFDLATTGENGVLSKRPYIATQGRHVGQSVIAVNTGQLSATGQPIYAERPINANATLRKDEWISLDNTIIEAARERLVIVEDLISMGLTYNVGGLGTTIAEWETGSEVTNASITMDGDSATERDRQEFGLAGVPIPIIHKDWKISERSLLASRQRGSALDVTTGSEMARSVGRTWETMVFNGDGLSAGTYTIPGLTTYTNRETYTISDWASSGTSVATIRSEMLEMIARLETASRMYGPFTFYVPGAYRSRFREDYKADSEKSLMTKMLDEDSVANIRFSDVLATGNVICLEMTRGVIDLAMAADVTTVQWQSGSGMTNMFKTYAASAPRIKSDYDGRCGILHGSTS